MSYLTSQKTNLEHIFLFILVFAPFLFFTQYLDYQQKPQIDFWWSKWAILGWAAALWYSYKLSEKYHWSVSIFSAYTLSHAIYYFLWKSHPDYNFYQFYRGTFHLLGADYAAMFVLFTAVFASFRSHHLRCLSTALGIACIANAMVLITTCLEHAEPYLRIGIAAHNSSMDSGFIAYTIPFYFMIPFLKWKESPWCWLLTLVPIGAVVYTQSDMGRASLVILFLCMALSYLREKKYFYIALGLLVGLGALLMHYSYHELVYTTGRSTMWRNAFDFFKKNCEHKWLGFGPESFVLFGPLIQGAYGTSFHSGTWAWLHNDPAQFLFEQGLAGILSASLVLFHALRRSFGQPILFGGLCAYIFYSFGSLPVHWGMSALAGMVLFSLALRQDVN